MEVRLKSITELSHSKVILKFLQKDGNAFELVTLGEVADQYKVGQEFNLKLDKIEGAD